MSAVSDYCRRRCYRLVTSASWQTPYTRGEHYKCVNLAYVERSLAKHYLGHLWWLYFLAPIKMCFCCVLPSSCVFAVAVDLFCVYLLVLLLLLLLLCAVAASCCHRVLLLLLLLLLLVCRFALKTSNAVYLLRYPSFPPPLAVLKTASSVGGFLKPCLDNPVRHSAEHIIATIPCVVFPRYFRRTTSPMMRWCFRHFRSSCDRYRTFTCCLSCSP